MGIRIDRHDVDAVEIVVGPGRREAGVAAVRGQEIADDHVDQPVLPGDDDERTPVFRRLQRGLQTLDIGEADLCIDRQTERDRARLDRDQRADVIVRLPVVLLLLRGVGGENRVRLAEMRGDERGRRQRTVEAATVVARPPGGFSPWRTNTIRSSAGSARAAAALAPASASAAMTAAPIDLQSANVSRLAIAIAPEWAPLGADVQS